MNIASVIYTKFINKHLKPSLRAVYLIRKMQYHSSQKGRFNRYLADLTHLKLVKEFGMCISPTVEIGIGLKITHPTGIVLGSATVIGENCSIYQNVTVGGARIGDAKNHNQPHSGNNVILFLGSMVLGAVKVVDGCILAANSVLLSDALTQGVYVGSPAQKVSSNENNL